MKLTRSCCFEHSRGQLFERGKSEVTWSFRRCENTGQCPFHFIYKCKLREQFIRPKKTVKSLNIIFFSLWSPDNLNNLCFSNQWNYNFNPSLASVTYISIFLVWVTGISCVKYCPLKMPWNVAVRLYCKCAEKCALEICWHLGPLSIIGSKTNT